LAKQKKVTKPSLSFELSEAQAKAIKDIAGDSGVRISGYLDGKTLKIDSVAINAGVVGISSTPFELQGMAPFIACNGPLPSTDLEEK
jgi:hypothetical protein